MSRSNLIEKIEKSQLKKDIPPFRVGDTVSVHTRIIEGEKERIQVFTGVVIARKGKGLSETFSVFRVAYGEGLERIFPLHSPLIAKIELVKHGEVRRSKLYYLRDATGKAAKIKGSYSRKKAELLEEEGTILEEKSREEATEAASQ